MMKKINIGICSGGTGGHLFPAQATLNCLLNYYKKTTGKSSSKYIPNIFFFTDKRTKIYFKNIDKSIKVKTILSLPFSGKSKVYKIKALIYIFLGFIQTSLNFIFNRPNIIVAFGGYVSVPVLLAATLLRIPIILHEQNAILGKANKLFIRFAKIMATNFNHTIGVEKYKNKVVRVGLPIRKNLFISNEILENKAKDFNYLNSCSSLGSTIEDKENKITPRVVISILGGSQGANIFGKFIPQSLALLPLRLRQNLTVYHQCREELIEEVKKEWEKTNINYIVKPFFHQIGNILNNTHLVVSRAGASTIAEINFVGKSALYIPFKKAVLNHQEYNAREMVDKNCAKILLEEDLNYANFNAIILQLLDNQKILNQMGSLARMESISNSDCLLTSLIIQIAENKNVRL